MHCQRCLQGAPKLAQPPQLLYHAAKQAVGPHHRPVETPQACMANICQSSQPWQPAQKTLHKRSARMCRTHAAASTKRSVGDASTPVFTREGLMSLKVVDLQAMLQDRQLTKSGKKELLVERLLSHYQATTSTATGTADPEQAGVPIQAPKLRSRTPGSDTAGATVVPMPSGVPAEATRVVTASQTAAAIAASLAPRRRVKQSPEPEAAPQLEQAQVQPADRQLERSDAVVGNGQGSSGAGIDLASLPPMPVLTRGRSWAVQERPDMDNEELARVLQSNPTDFQVATLGTAADVPGLNRALASVALCRGKDVWLFDVGDDTQRQLGVVPHIKPSKVYRIFITSLTPEAILGLPGMLCSISGARAKGHEKTDIPVHVYGPPGLAYFLASVFKVSNTYLETNILVVEFASAPVDDDLREPDLFNRRARIFRALIPPDQLNPDGCFNGDLQAFMPTHRATQARGVKASAGVLATDERAVFLPFPRMPPGNPDRPDSIHPSELQWTIDVDSGARMTVVALPGAKPTFAYIVQEAERAGTLVVQRAEALGVSRGKNYSLLKDGLTVMNAAGVEIFPEMVCTPAKPGRRVVVMGNTSRLPGPGSAFNQHAQGADAWVSGCVSANASAGGGGVPTQQLQAPCLDAGHLAAVAAELQVQVLLLARFSTILSTAPGASLQNNVDGDEVDVEWRVQTALHKARAAVEDEMRSGKGAGQDKHRTHVAAACDFWVQVFEKHEGPTLPQPAGDVNGAAV